MSILGVSNSKNKRKSHVSVKINRETQLNKVKGAKPRVLGKGVRNVQPVVKTNHSTCLSDIKKIIQESMKANNLSPEDAIRIIGDKRYER